MTQKLLPAVYKISGEFVIIQ